MVFLNFLENLNKNPIKDYFECYSSYVISRKDLRNNILEYRKNFLIKYYIENNNNEKYESLNSIYRQNFNDNYPLYNINKIISYKKKLDYDYEEKRDDDVELHYKNMFTNPPPIIPKTEEEDNEYIEEHTETGTVVSDVNYNFEDDYYDDDYYEEEYYNDNDYDDIDDIDDEQL